MPSEPEWLEYAKLGVAALTPIMTGVVGIILVRLGTKLDLSPRWRLEAGFTENLADQQATTDFGVFSGIVRRF